MMILTKTGEKDDNIQLSDGKNRAWFAFLDGGMLNHEEYVALAEENTEDLLVLKVLHNEGREQFATIDDDREFDAAVEMFRELFDEEDG